MAQISVWQQITAWNKCCEWLGAEPCKLNLDVPSEADTYGTKRSLSKSTAVTSQEDHRTV